MKIEEVIKEYEQTRGSYFKKKMKIWNDRECKYEWDMDFIKTYFAKVIDCVNETGEQAFIKLDSYYSKYNRQIQTNYLTIKPNGQLSISWYA